MNTAVFVSSLEYIDRNYTLTVSLSSWIYESLSKYHFEDRKLLRSIKKQDYEVTSSIIKYIKDPHLLTEVAVYSFCFSGDLHFIIKLFIEYGITQDVHIFGNFLLSKAAEFGYIDVVKLLLAFGIDPNINYMEYTQSDYDSIYEKAYRMLTNRHCNALLHACDNKQYDIIDLLLHDTKVTSDTKSRALSCIIVNEENISIAKLLIENGADVNYNDGSLILFACEDDNIIKAKLLIDSGLNLEKYGNGALFAASYLSILEVVEYLLDKGVIPNMTHPYVRNELPDNILELLLEVNSHLFD